jgi:hypothetical protein
VVHRLAIVGHFVGQPLRLSLDRRHPLGQPFYTFELFL